MKLFGRRGRENVSLDEGAPIDKVPYVVIDTELTGLDDKKDSIVSIGALRMYGGNILLGNEFYRLVNPRTGLTPQSVVIHEITPSDVSSSPAVDVVLRELVAFCTDAVLVGHFISIDLSFINRELRRMESEKLGVHAIDTYSIYEWLRKRHRERECFATPLEGYRLHDIARCFKIPVSNAHNAIMDAFTTAQLFQRFIPLLIEAGARDIGDLLRIGIPFKGGDRFGLSGEFSNF
jgi:DNA polymerase-3 subunit epsilon